MHWSHKQCNWEEVSCHATSTDVKRPPLTPWHTNCDHTTHTEAIPHAPNSSHWGYATPTEAMPHSLRPCYTHWGLVTPTKIMLHTLRQSRKNWGDVTHCHIHWGHAIFTEAMPHLTTQLHEHIGQSDHCTFTCTHQVHVNVQWPVCLKCACKCAVSQTIDSLHIFMHTSVIGLTSQLHEHIRQSNHCTFTCTRQVLVNVQWPACLTCACKCAQLAHCIFSCTHRSLGSLPNYKNTSDNRITARLHAHIRHMWTSSDDPSVWRVHVNAQWVRQLTYCTFLCTHRSLGSLPNYMNTSDSRITERLHARDENSSRLSTKIRSNTFSGRPVSSSVGHLAD